jgi:transcriptional regulator with XRE-family HTH domain
VVQFATIFHDVPPTKPFAKESQRIEFSRRLREELHRSGREASPVALAREINLHLRPAERVHASSCRKWLHAQSIPTQEKLQVLARLLQVPPSWLRFGQLTELSEPEPMAAPLSPDELALIDSWRLLSAGQRRTVRLLMGQLLRTD